MSEFELSESSLDLILSVYKEIGALPEYKDTLFEQKKVSVETLKTVEDCNTLEELRCYIESFEDCPLKHISTNTVFSDGNPNSKLMLIGEAPGEEEDLQGKPFVGRSGQLLDKMLAAIGIDRTSCYIANIIPWRPPGNRVPTPTEIEMCRAFIKKHIKIIKPKVIVCLGSTATRSLLSGNPEIVGPISMIRGKIINYRDNDFETVCIPTFHPAYLLRSPSNKVYAFEDLKLIKSIIKD